MHKIKEKLMEILDEYEDRARNNPDGRLSDMEIQKIHMLTDTVKNICKIEMLEYGEVYSERVDGDDRIGYSRDGEWMARGGYGGNSYREGGSSYARRRRDSMGRYSRADGKEYMAEKLREMMMEADGEEREAIRKCLKEIEKA